MIGQTTPPDTIEQLELMRQGVSYRFLIKCRAFSLSVRPLSIEENIEIYSKVVDRMTKMPEQQRTALTEHSLLAIETLVLASTSDVGTNDPRVTEYILGRMTSGEIHHLFKQYAAETAKVDPSLDLMEPEQLQALVDALKKSPPEELAFQLTELSFSDLASVCRKLISEG